VSNNGWPTGRSLLIAAYARQSDVPAAIIRTVYRLRNELNVSHYDLFVLKDASSSQDVFHHLCRTEAPGFSPL